jgi:hypothetical protein
LKALDRKYVESEARRKVLEGRRLNYRQFGNFVVSHAYQQPNKASRPEMQRRRSSNVLFFVFLPTFKVQQSLNNASECQWQVRGRRRRAYRVWPSESSANTKQRQFIWSFVNRQLARNCYFLGRPSKRNQRAPPAWLCDNRAQAVLTV